MIMHTLINPPDNSFMRKDSSDSEEDAQQEGLPVKQARLIPKRG